MTDQSQVATLEADQAQLENVVRDVVAHARAGGATQAEAAVSVDAGLSVTVRLGEVETLEYHSDRGLGVTVYCGKSKGSASSADLSPAAVEKTVAKALSIARFTADDPCAGLADAELMAQEIPDLDLCHPWALTPAAAIAIATECEQAARDVDARITNTEGATVSTHHGLRVYANSHGFSGGYPTTGHSISCSVVASQDDGTMERDYWYDSARAHTDLAAASAIGRTAGERTVRRLGAGKAETAKTPVLFPPELARGLIGHLLGALRGTVQYRQSSFLLDAVGASVFPDFVQISERPHIPRALGSAPVDNEGVATRARELVSDGVVQGYILGSYSARKLGLQTTGNAGGVHNIIVGPSVAAGLEELATQMHRGLIVGELMGQGINMVTGDYSRGAAGFWVENGKVVMPVHEITIAGNLRDMFHAIVAIGNDIDRRGRVHCGSILVEQMTIAGS